MSTILIDRPTNPDRLTVHTHRQGTRDLGPSSARWTLGDLLDRVALTSGHPNAEVVLLLTARVMAGLGLPTDRAPDGGHWVGLDAVRTVHRWTVSRLSGWTTFHRREGAGTAVVHVGFGPWALGVGRCPFLQGNTTDALARFDAWQERTGRAWHGTPGVAGVSLMRAHVAGVKAAQHSAGRGKAPRWQLGEAVPEHVVKAALTTDRDFTRDWTPQSLELGAHRHEFDLNAAYLAAAVVARVARDGLTHMPRLLADERTERHLAGYFLVDADGWHDDRLPDPAAGTPTRAAARRPAVAARWVTGPTLDLLDELREAGFHGGYTILDAWAAPGLAILRPWAELLRDTMRDARYAGDEATVAAVKAAYREGLGMVARPGGLIYRPDWFSAVVAQSRVNLWRKLRTIGLRTGHWPMAIDVDAVTYTTDQEDPRAFAAELGLALNSGQLGAWKHKASTAAELATR